MSVAITNFGATIMSIKIPDHDGRTHEVTLGFDTLEEYLKYRTHMSPIAGRVANRIARGKFTLDGNTYQLSCNDGRNHLHGGPKGWAKLTWKAEGYDDRTVRLSYHSPDGEEGYPGNVDVSVTYSLEDTNSLLIHIEALTDAPTLVNPTSHCYFNFHRDHSQTILDHLLQINAAAFTPSDAELIPTGEIQSVANTPMDFRSLRKVGKEINADYNQLRNARGYDHNWVLDNYDGTLKLSAILKSEDSGINMETWTNQPGIQCYTGNTLGKYVGRNGLRYPPYSGICLETQGFPDAINHPGFPSVVLRPGESYSHETKYAFGLL